MSSQSSLQIHFLHPVIYRNVCRTTYVFRACTFPRRAPTLSSSFLLHRTIGGAIFAIEYENFKMGMARSLLRTTLPSSSHIKEKKREKYLTQQVRMFEEETERNKTLLTGAAVHCPDLGHIKEKGIIFPFDWFLISFLFFLIFFSPSFFFFLFWQT